MVDFKKMHRTSLWKSSDGQYLIRRRSILVKGKTEHRYDLTVHGSEHWTAHVSLEAAMAAAQREEGCD